MRVVKFHFQGHGTITSESEVKKVIPKEIMNGTAEDLYSFIAAAIKEANPPRGAKAGFTFSFPSTQYSLSRCTLNNWTKGFRTSGCVGKDPAELLNQELKNLDIELDIVAVLNDTVGTLISRSYIDPCCKVGVILGTGFNICYLDSISNIKKLHYEGNDTQMIVNMECGNTGHNDKMQLPYSELDAELDPTTPNPTFQITEKLCSGMYLGELTRLWIMKLWREKQIFSGLDLTALEFSHPFSFGTPYCSEILGDTSDNLEVLTHILEQYGITNVSLKDKKTVHEIVDLVITRSARIFAALIYGIFHHIGDMETVGTVGVDGSVFKYVPGYQQKLSESLHMLGIKPVVGFADDGSGIGAALVAYTAN